MKKLILIAVIIALSISAVFAGGGKEKNKIVIYTSMYQEATDNLKKELKKFFPKYTIDFIYGGTGRIQHMIASEHKSGRLGCDIIMLAEPSYSIELKEKDMLHSFRPIEALNLAFSYDPDGYWYPVRINNMVLAYNPAKFQKNAVPNSFYDFAYDARARDAISMRNPSVSGTTLGTLTALRDKYGYEYFNALGRQRVHIDYGTAEAVRKLESGEYKVIMILEESILQLRESGSKLEVIYPTDGTVMIPSNIMIVNNRLSANRNVKAAEVIANWFLSESGQEAIVESWMHSVRIDFPKLPYDAIPTGEIRQNSMPVSWENSYHQRDEIIKRFEERK